MSKIQWTGETWNPVTGCTKVSAGCKHCYAERVFSRVYGRDLVVPPGEDPRKRYFIDVRLHPDRLDQPLRWRKPRRVFVNSMSDLFHEDVPDEFIDDVFARMMLAHQHTYQILTKRPERMLTYMTGDTHLRCTRLFRNFHEYTVPVGPWPLSNVWLGVSVEDQATANERIPLLLQTPAAVRFVSYEPALGPVDFDCYPSTTCPTNWLDTEPGIDWLIVGGESGPHARPFDVQWARDTIRQCKTAGVACFVKQLGAHAVLDPRYDRTLPGATRKLHDHAGGDPAEWPEDLRVREWPDERSMLKDAV